MKLRRLRNDYLKNRCDVNKKAYDAQRNLCVSLARKAKLNIPQYEDHLVSAYNIDDPIIRLKKKKIENHQSIQLIKCHCENLKKTFSFSNKTHTQIKKKIKVARMVNIKLDFTDSSFCNLIILINGKSTT